MRACSCSMTFSRSSGAVAVRDTAPAMPAAGQRPCVMGWIAPPAMKCFHQMCASEVGSSALSRNTCTRSMALPRGDTLARSNAETALGRGRRTRQGQQYESANIARQSLIHGWRLLRPHLARGESGSVGLSCLCLFRYAAMALKTVRPDPSSASTSVCHSVGICLGAAPFT